MPFPVAFVNWSGGPAEPRVGSWSVSAIWSVKVAPALRAVALRLSPRGMPHHRCSGVRTRLYPLSTAGDGTAPVIVAPYHILFTAKAWARCRQAGVGLVPPSGMQSTSGSIDGSYAQPT